MQRIVRTVLQIASVLPIMAGAQSASLRGRVLTDSTEVPVAGVTVAIDALKLHAVSDSAGGYALIGIQPGIHTVTVRKVGFEPITTQLAFTAGTSIEADLMVTASAQALPGVKVETKPEVHGKLAEFEERRLAGNGGRYLTQADLEKHAFANTGDALRMLPGIDIRRKGSELIAVAGRMAVPACAMCGGGQGPPPPCPAAVAIDGAFVYQGNDGEKPFNLNQIIPSSIAGVEYYAGGASMPVKYNATRASCGLLLIWTK